MVKKGPWTEEEDGFLLTYCDVGPDFIASHDLGRADGAGMKRLTKLIRSGAAEQYAAAMEHLHAYRIDAGLCRSAFGQEMAQDAIAYWDDKRMAWQADRLEFEGRPA